MAQTPDSADDLKKEARKVIDELPAETALGNKDPQGGGTTTPKEYEAEHDASTGKESPAE